MCVFTCVCIVCKCGLLWQVLTFPISVQARLFDEPQLASLCLESIDKNTADAIAAEGFTDIDLGESGPVGPRFEDCAGLGSGWRS